MSDNLKPCPYHGDPHAMEFSAASKEYACCTKCDRDGTRWYRPIEDWNNAHCWKLLDSSHETIRVLREIIDEYVTHDPSCILNRWEAGEPTENGGYRTKYAGKWYQSKPIDETPKCNCGFEALLVTAKE